jgi:hypothetical protein
VRRVLLLDEVPFEPLWAELLARWGDQPGISRHAS